MGAQASAPEAPPLSRSQALASRQLRVKGADGADDFGSISPLQLLRAQGLLPPLGDWWSTPAAHALCTALEEALESMPSPARSHAHAAPCGPAPPNSPIEAIKELRKVRCVERRAFGRGH